MQVIRGMTIPCLCCGNASGGQGMTNQVQKSIKSCKGCLQHESNSSKVPQHPVVSTATMDLLHIDFTSIQVTMELNRLPKVVNIWVFQYHFAKHIMAYVTPDQTRSGLHLNLWSSGQAPKWSWCECHEQCYWLDVQNPQHDEVVNHILSPPDEWVGREVSLNYHADDWEAGRRWKTNWLSHLAEIVHAYNAIWSAVIEYSPHYLMFGHWPRLPVDFYFPSLKTTEGPRRVPSPGMLMNL